MAKSPFETRCPTRVSIKLSFKALAAASKTLLRTKCAHENQPADWFSVLRLRRTPFFVHGLAEQVGHSLTGKYPTGIFSDSVRLLRRRTKGSFRKGTENQRMGNLRFASIAKKYSTGIFFTVRSKIAYRRSPRVRTPAAYFKARSRPFGNPSSFLVRVTVCRRQGGNVRTPHGGCVPSGAPVCAGTTLWQYTLWDNCGAVSAFSGLGAQCGSTTCFYGADLRAQAGVSPPTS